MRKTPDINPWLPHTHTLKHMYMYNCTHACRPHTHDKDKETLKRQMPSRHCWSSMAGPSEPMRQWLPYTGHPPSPCPPTFTLSSVSPAKLPAHGIFRACRRLCRITSPTWNCLIKGHTTLETLTQMTVPKGCVALTVTAVSKLLAAPLLCWYWMSSIFHIFSNLMGEKWHSIVLNV